MYMQTVLAVLIELRRGEINGLKYSDVDYINQTLKVQRQLGKKTNAKKKNCEREKSNICAFSFSNLYTFKNCFVIMSLLHSRKMSDTVWHYSVLRSDVLSAKIYFVTFTRHDLKKTCIRHRFCGFVTNSVTNIFENVADSKRTKSHKWRF